jgi:hypothetical protein
MRPVFLPRPVGAEPGRLSKHRFSTRASDSLGRDLQVSEAQLSTGCGGDQFELTRSVLRSGRKDLDQTHRIRTDR